MEVENIIFPRGRYPRASEQFSSHPALLRDGLARLTDFRTAALIKENQNYKELGRLIDGDIFKLEKAICHLTD